jgi:hypothetical protein
MTDTHITNDAGGVQELSAAPARAGWKWVPEDATEEMVRATDKVNFANADTDGTMHNVWHVMLAASPTPPAAQTVGRDEDEALDLLAILFDAWENGTPCYEEPESSDGYVGQAFRIDDDVFHRCVDLLTRRRSKTDTPPAEQQAEPGVVYAELPKPNLPRGGFPDLFTADQMRDFADSTHALRMQAAPKAAPGEPTQEMIAAVMSLVDLESSDPEDHRYDDGSKLAAQICRAVLALVPQQEAQEPFGWVCWIGEDSDPRSAQFSPVEPLAYSNRKPLYTAPQPAPAPLSDDAFLQMRNALEAARNGLTWFMEMHPEDCNSSDDEMLAQIDAALAAQGGK